MLHVIETSHPEGEEVAFADIYNVGSQMKRQYPGYFQLLCDIPVDFIDMGEGMYGPYTQYFPQTIFR